MPEIELSPRGRAAIRIKAALAGHDVSSPGGAVSANDLDDGRPAAAETADQPMASDPSRTAGGPAGPPDPETFDPTRPGGQAAGQAPPAGARPSAGRPGVTGADQGGGGRGPSGQIDRAQIGRGVRQQQFEESTRPVPETESAQEVAADLRRQVAEQASRQTSTDVRPSDVQVRRQGDQLVARPTATGLERIDEQREAIATDVGQRFGPDPSPGGGPTPELGATSEAVQQAESQVQAEYPGFERGEEFTIDVERQGNRIVAETAFTEQGQRMATLSELEEQGIDRRNVVFERTEAGELEARVDPAAAGRGSLGERSQSMLSPAAALALSGASDEQLAAARRGERRLAGMAERGNLAAQVFQGGEALQRFGGDVETGVAGATEGPLSAVGGGLARLSPVGVGATITDYAGITEGAGEAVESAGEEVGRQAASGTGMVVGGAPFVAGTVASGTVAYGGLAGQQAAGRSGAEIERTTDAGIERGAFATGSQAAAEPVAAGVLLASPFAARGAGRAAGRGARVATERVGQLDAETIVQGARGQARDFAADTRAGSGLGGPAARLTSRSGQRGRGGQRSRGGRDAAERVRIAEEGFGSSEPPAAMVESQARFATSQRSGLQPGESRIGGGPEPVSQARLRIQDQMLRGERISAAGRRGARRGQVGGTVAAGSGLVDDGQPQEALDMMEEVQGPEVTATDQVPSRRPGRAPRTAADVLGGGMAASAFERPQAIPQEVLDRIEEVESPQVTTEDMGPRGGEVRVGAVGLAEEARSGLQQLQAQAQRSEVTGAQAGRSVLDASPVEEARTRIGERAAARERMGVEQRAGATGRQRTGLAELGRTDTPTREIAEPTGQFDVPITPPPPTTGFDIPDPTVPDGSARIPGGFPIPPSGGGGGGSPLRGGFSTEGRFGTGFETPEEILSGFDDDGEGPFEMGGSAFDSLDDLYSR